MTSVDSEIAITPGYGLDVIRIIENSKEGLTREQIKQIREIFDRWKEDPKCTEIIKRRIVVRPRLDKFEELNKSGLAFRRNLFSWFSPPENCEQWKKTLAAHPRFVDLSRTTTSKIKPGEVYFTYSRVV